VAYMNTRLQKVIITEKEKLRNLYSFYLHDLSAYSSALEINSLGTYEFDAFEEIWDRDGITPYFIMFNDQLAGFLLFLEAPFLTKVDYCINDLFLLHPYRGNGIAEEALASLFSEKKGEYYMVQLKSNLRAIGFWKKLLQKNQFSYEEMNEVKDGEEVVSQRFIVKRDD
jgi:predicted acetyltransferase